MTDQQVSMEDASGLGRRVTHIEGIVSDLRAGQASLASQLNSVVNSLENITSRLNQPQEKTSYTAIATAAVAVLLLLGAIGASNLAPLYTADRRMEVEHTAMLKITLEEAKEQAAIDTTAQYNKERLDRIEDLIFSGLKR